MKRRFLWLVAVAGFVWLYLRRGVRRPQPVVQIPPAPDPAEELRRKLEQTKERIESPATHLAEPEPEAGTDVEPPGPVASEELDAKRREVHERARSAADEMHRSSSD